MTFALTRFDVTRGMVHEGSGNTRGVCRLRHTIAWDRSERRTGRVHRVGVWGIEIASLVLFVMLPSPE